MGDEERAPILTRTPGAPDSPRTPDSPGDHGGPESSPATPSGAHERPRVRGRLGHRRQPRHEGQARHHQTLTLAAGVALVIAVTAATTSWLVSAAGMSPAAHPLPTVSVSPTPTATPSPSDSPTPEPTPPPSTANYADAWIPMPQTRLDEMAQYALLRYGTATSELNPSMVVLHFTEGNAQGTISFFAQDLPQSGVYPGVCAHFVIDQAGVVYRLVPTTTMCRHTVGLNDKAIGIEIEQSTFGNSAAWADQQILDRPAQIDAVLATLKDLQHTYGIPTDRIIGHGMANDDPEFRDLTGARNDHTDMGTAAVLEIRHRLDALP